MTAFSQPARMYGSRQWTTGAIRINSFSTNFNVHEGKKSMNIILAKTLLTNQTSFAKSLPPTSRHRGEIHHQQTNELSWAMQNTPDKQLHPHSMICFTSVKVQIRHNHSFIFKTFWVINLPDHSSRWRWSVWCHQQPLDVRRRTI